MVGIGIVGAGYVGHSLHRAYRTCSVPIEVFDIDQKPEKECTCKTLEELVEKVRYIFICLPTPTKEGQDVSIIEETLEKINKYQDKVVIIKSTVLPSNLTKFEKTYTNIKFACNPEFLSEATAYQDSIAPKRIVLGSNVEGLVKEIKEKLFFKYWKVPYFETTLENAMKCKYGANAFGAMMVNYFNILHEWAGSQENYEVIRESMIASGWVNRQYTNVPNRGKYGFSGNCFPKDILALSRELYDVGLIEESLFLSSCENLNRNIKKKRDA